MIRYKSRPTSISRRELCQGKMTQLTATRQASLHYLAARLRSLTISALSLNWGSSAIRVGLDHQQTCL